MFAIQKCVDDPPSDHQEFVSEVRLYNFTSFALLKQYVILFTIAMIEHAVIIIIDLIFVILNLWFYHSLNVNKSTLLVILISFRSLSSLTRVLKVRELCITKIVICSIVYYLLSLFFFFFFYTVSILNFNYSFFVKNRCVKNVWINVVAGRDVVR